MSGFEHGWIAREGFVGEIEPEVLAPGLGETHLGQLVISLCTSTRFVRAIGDAAACGKGIVFRARGVVRVPELLKHAEVVRSKLARAFKGMENSDRVPRRRLPSRRRGEKHGEAASGVWVMASNRSSVLASARKSFSARFRPIELLENPGVGLGLVVVR